MKKIAFLTYPIVAVVSLFAAGAAFADGDTIDTTFAAAQSTKTRDQVRAELVQARADGSIKVSSNQYNALLVAKSLKSRDEVRAEAVAANRADHDDVWYGEDSGSFALQRTAPARVATPVYAAR